MPAMRLFLPAVLSAGVAAAVVIVSGDLWVMGSLGIGTTQPRAQLEATGPVHLASEHHASVVPGLEVGRMKVPVADGWSRLVSFSESADFLAPGDGLYGLWGTVENHSPGARFATGAHLNGVAVQDTGHAEGVAGVAVVAAGVAVEHVRGLYGEAKSNHLSGTARIEVARAAWLRNDYAPNTRIDDLYGAFVELNSLGTGSTAERYYGLYVDSAPRAGHIGSGYGLYLSDVGLADSGYGVYQAGSDDVNHFAGPVGIGTDKPSYPLEVAGAVRASAFVTAVHMRQASNIRPLQGALDGLSDVAAVRYDLSAASPAGGVERRSEVGLRPEDLAHAFPELVATDAADGEAAVDYGQLTAVLVAAVQELRRAQTTELAALRAANVAQQARIATLEARLDALEGIAGVAP
jgi:hypothetical protein